MHASVLPHIEMQVLTSDAWHLVNQPAVVILGIA